MHDELGTRIKKYEAVYDHKLTPNSCVFIRVDGKAFHTFTKHCSRPFDSHLTDAMIAAAKSTAKEMQGFKLAYHQSDEVTFMITDFDRFETQGWYNYELNKLVSITASLFTAHFNNWYKKSDSLAFFDARAFVVPFDDAPNVFVWRQKDWERNSIQMCGQDKFSYKELQGKNNKQVLEMLEEARSSWENLYPWNKYGTFIDKNFGFTCESLNYYQIAELIKV